MTRRLLNNSHVFLMLVVPALAATAKAARALVRTRAITVAVLAVLGLSLIACGGSSSKSSTPASTVAITTSTPTATVAASGSTTLTASVTGSSNTAVTWSCTGGTITAGGVYTAPATAGPYTCTATSQADPTKSVPITVTVTAVAGSVTITPPAGPFYATKSYQFSANVAVTWSVQGGNGNGTINASGLYTAPATAGSYTVVATSQADTTKSATSPIAVTIPNPTFSSVPSTTLAEATATYTYPITATDPAGTAITYSLTTSVTGASISSSTLSWTPTGTPPLTGREMPTSFTVKATTALGGTNTQTWTVTPLRAVTLTVIDNFWASAGKDTEAIPTPIPPPVDVIVPGSSTPLVGVLGTDNSGYAYYTFHNVPAGYYWLEGGPTEKFWTNTSSFDVGTDYVGQKLSGNATAMTLDIAPPTGLTIDPFAAGDAIWIGSADANSWYNPTTQPAASATSSVFTDVTDSIPLLTLPALTVDSYILQYEWGTPGGTYYQGLSLTASQTEGSGFNYTSPISGSLLPSATPETLSLQMTGWAALATEGEATFFGTYLSALPYTTPPLAAIGGGMPSCIMGSGFVPCGVANSNYVGINGWPAGSGPEPATITNAPHDDRQNGGPGPLYMAWAERCLNTGAVGDGCNGAADGDAVTLSFSAPFTTAPPYVLWSQQETSVLIGSFEQLFTMYSNSAVEFTSIPSGTQTVQPVVGTVKSPTINGADLFTAASPTAPLKLSWTAPTTNYSARLAGYDVTVYAVPTTPTGYWGSVVAKFYTPTPSVTLPTGKLPAGTYVFVIEAIADGTADVTAKPYRSGYPNGKSQVVSQAMTITGS